MTAYWEHETLQGRGKDYKQENMLKQLAQEVESSSPPTLSERTVNAYESRVRADTESYLKKWTQDRSLKEELAALKEATKQRLDAQGIKLDAQGIKEGANDYQKQYDKLLLDHVKNAALRANSVTHSETVDGVTRPLTPPEQLKRALVDVTEIIKLNINAQDQAKPKEQKPGIDPGIVKEYPDAANDKGNIQEYPDKTNDSGIIYAPEGKHSGLFRTAPTLGDKIAWVLSYDKMQMASLDPAETRAQLAADRDALSTYVGSNVGKFSAEQKAAIRNAIIDADSNTMDLSKGFKFGSIKDVKFHDGKDGTVIIEVQGLSADVDAKKLKEAITIEVTKGTFKDVDIKVQANAAAPDMGALTSKSNERANNAATPDMGALTSKPKNISAEAYEAMEGYRNAMEEMNSLRNKPGPADRDVKKPPVRGGRDWTR